MTDVDVIFMVSTTLSHSFVQMLPLTESREGGIIAYI